MGKKTKTKDPNVVFTACPPFPKQPWIYMSDPTDNSAHADKVKEMIDGFSIGHTNDDISSSTAVTPVDNLLASLDKFKDSRPMNKKAFLVVDKLNRLDYENGERVEAATKLREHAAKSGRSFASINLYMTGGTKQGDMKKWGPNHLELAVADLTVTQVAEKVYKWLFTVIPPTEHIFLLTTSKLQVTNNKQYPEYEYCPLADIRNRPKDAKIQFGVVITSKPTVVPNTQRLHWTVADKSGTGNFYFQYRGASSQYTWDWVISLKPGDIKSLPRMPSLQITEPRTVRVAKFPLRTVSFAVSTVGIGIKTVGHGLVKVGDVMSMGKSSEYVPRSDVDKKTGKKINWGKIFEQEGKDREMKVEKARKDITDRIMARFAKKQRDLEKDSCDDSTLRDSVSGKDVLSEKQFC